MTEFSGSFDVDENGNPVPNTYVPCAGCGEACPLVTLIGDGLDIARNPNIRVLCAKCWAVEGAEQITAEAAKDSDA